MWVDPLDELIADLEEIAPPEQPKYGGGYEALTEVQHWAAVLLRRADAVYPNLGDPDDTEIKEAVEKGRRAMNRYIGRPEDWTPGS